MEKGLSPGLMKIVILGLSKKMKELAREQ